MVITIFDALGIQDYLFGSNRLADNIGASFLVNQAMTTWPLDAARSLCGLKVNPANGEKLVFPGILEGAPFQVELVYSAGGNAILLVSDLETAKKLTTAYSRKLLEQAPGLDVACFHHEIRSASFLLGQELMEAMRGVAVAKENRIFGNPLLGLGVTQLCASGTEEPALFWDPLKKRFLGPSAWAKLQNSRWAKEFLKEFVKPVVPPGFDLPDELDDLGRSRGERSYIGVVHIDGNGIGQELQSILNRTDGGTNQVHLMSIRRFSDEVRQAGEKAIRAAIKQVIQNPDTEEESVISALNLASDSSSGKLFLPIRPLVYGGDDITFVCDGRIALDLAVTCLESFSEGSLRYACAGVALVKSHYPFSRAYALAEELCRNAKKELRKPKREGAALDWQVFSGGPMMPVASLRNREYVAQDGKRLTHRPYFVLPEKPGDIQDWTSFRDKLLIPLQRDKPWINAHSRLKGLAQYLRRGSAATQLILDDWRTKRYELPQYSTAVLTDGFFADATPYLDAIELLDFMVPMS